MIIISQNHLNIRLNQKEKHVSKLIKEMQKSGIVEEDLIDKKSIFKIISPLDLVDENVLRYQSKIDGGWFDVKRQKNEYIIDALIQLKFGMQELIPASIQQRDESY